ncbi:hypothetical protein [Desulforhabdus amnigena]|uniref:Periplasmic heavy metal sensor n=1 Tax=Desulforhabdus amnigena TaxID=40218 RepID=A0A9W6D000_9BACT|nr:hypothetical protein [Desulforhabdus amnigena]GLI33315.1 hypothetical protein DAMNIGENAA_07480 [Desulforhabdus amnigena]
MKKIYSIMYILFAFALAFSPPAAYAQQKTDEKAPSSTGAESAGHQHGGMKHERHHKSGEGYSEMMERCKEMMAKHDQMVAEMKAMDEALDAKVTTMKTAKGDDKIAAMEAVIELMTTQRKEMRAKMADMQHAGMCCMMEKMHRNKGYEGMKGMKGMSSMCPMMEENKPQAQPETGKTS